MNGGRSDFTAVRHRIRRFLSSPGSTGPSSTSKSVVLTGAIYLEDLRWGWLAEIGRVPVFGGLFLGAKVRETLVDFVAFCSSSHLRLVFPLLAAAAAVILMPEPRITRSRLGPSGRAPPDPPVSIASRRASSTSISLLLLFLPSNLPSTICLDPPRVYLHVRLTKQIDVLGDRSPVATFSILVWASCRLPASPLLFYP